MELVQRLGQARLQVHELWLGALRHEVELSCLRWRCGRICGLLVFAVNPEFACLACSPQCIQGPWCEDIVNVSSVDASAALHRAF